MEILERIIATLSDKPLLDIRMGTHWTAVVAEAGDGPVCGLASNPHKGEALLTPDEQAQLQAENTTLDLCRLALDTGSKRVTIGIAAINALLPRQPDTWLTGNADGVIGQAGKDKHVVLVGHFPFVDDLRQQVGHLDILELKPQPGDKPASQAAEVIPQADVVAITSMTLINGTLLDLLALCSPMAHVILLGPSTPLSPILFDYGVDQLCGSIVDDVAAVTDGVTAGHSFRQIKKQGGVQLVTVQRTSDKQH